MEGWHRQHLNLLNPLPPRLGRSRESLPWQCASSLCRTIPPLTTYLRKNFVFAPPPNADALLACHARGLCGSACDCNVILPSADARQETPSSATESQECTLAART